MYLLSNTTIWWRYIYYLLHREQLHVSALDNGRLQVVMKHLVSSYTKHIYGLLIWGSEGVAHIYVRYNCLLSVSYTT